MKRFLLMLLVLVMAFTLINCDGKKTDKPPVPDIDTVDTHVSDVEVEVEDTTEVPVSDTETDTSKKVLDIDGPDKAVGRPQTD